MNNKVFNYYKKKYKLNIKLKYSYAYGALGVYNTKTKIIKIDKKQIERMTKKDYYGVYELGLFLNDKRQIFNFTLLHELKHAIDLKNKKHYLLSQTKLLDLKANRWAFKRYKGIKEVRNIGVDRKDNNKGYEFDNIDLCCKRCNETKNNNFSYKEMLKIGKLLRKIYNKRKIINEQ